jgi:threonine dehydrogenase-like Zn-dependent dehydrogenase
MDLTGGQGVDVAFIAADDVTLVNRAIEMVKRRGAIVLIALLTHAPLKFMAYDMIAKELRLVGSNMSNKHDVRKAIELAASRQVDVEGILTHKLSIDQAQHGMHLARTKEDGAIKVILNFAATE